MGELDEGETVQPGGIVLGDRRAWCVVRKGTHAFSSEPRPMIARARRKCVQYDAENGPLRARNRILCWACKKLSRWTRSTFACCSPAGRRAACPCRTWPSASALSASQCSRRRARLEQSGVIAGYHARLDPHRLGFGVTAFVQVTLARHSPDNARHFRALVERTGAIQQAYAVTGDADYLLKVACRTCRGLGPGERSPAAARHASPTSARSWRLEELKNTDGPAARRHFTSRRMTRTDYGDGLTRGIEEAAAWCRPVSCAAARPGACRLTGAQCCRGRHDGPCASASRSVAHRLA